MKKNNFKKNYNKETYDDEDEYDFEEIKKFRHIKKRRKLKQLDDFEFDKIEFKKGDLYKNE